MQLEHSGFMISPLHRILYSFLFFFLNDTATTEIYTLSLHDALPIQDYLAQIQRTGFDGVVSIELEYSPQDRKSTRLNSSHVKNSYAVFCLKKKTTSCATAQKYFRL